MQKTILNFNNKIQNSSLNKMKHMLLLCNGMNSKNQKVRKSKARNVGDCIAYAFFLKLKDIIVGILSSNSAQGYYHNKDQAKNYQSNHFFLLKGIFIQYIESNKLHA